MLTTYGSVCVSELRAPFGDDLMRWEAARDRAFADLETKLGFRVRKASEADCVVYVAEQMHEVRIGS